MDSSDKKISFGFSKISKKPTLLNKPEEKKVELIDCLEGQNIKIRNAVEVKEKPLIIPLEENKKNLVDRIKEIQEKRKINAKQNEETDIRPDTELTVDELAARELLRDAQNRLNNGTSNNQNLTLSIETDQDNLLTEGKEESTLEDYEKIPISDFGLAMLRGMGWKEGTGIGKTSTRFTPAAAPELRPKGLGLGATKLLQEELPKGPTCDRDGKILVLKKGSCVKVIAGSHKGQYCEVQGLDEESARVIVKTALKAEILTISESLLLVVTKEEYLKNSKVINSNTYNEYKEIESNNRNSEVVNERTENKNSDDNNKKESDQKPSNERNRYSQSADMNRSRKTDSDSDSSYESQSEKYNKVHKRKDKRRHRDKSRSPPSYRHKNGKKSKSRHRSRSSSSDSEYEKRAKERNRHHKEKKGKKNKR